MTYLEMYDILESYDNTFLAYMKIIEKEYDEYRKKVPMVSLRLECLKILFKSM